MPKSVKQRDILCIPREQCGGIPQMLSDVHALMHDTIGRIVVVETRDGEKFEGIMAAHTPLCQVGLYYAHPILTKSSVTLLPHKDEVVEKMVIETEDMLSLSVVMQDEKQLRGFVSDRDYAGCLSEYSEFEVWNADDEDLEALKIDMKGLGDSKGWSVDEMFSANDALGVKSTYDDNMSQYTTAAVEGDCGARSKAEEIAQEIERNPASVVQIRIENDDEERDIDKETPEFQVAGIRRSHPSRGSHSSSHRISHGNVRRSGSAQGRRDGMGNTGGRGGRSALHATGANAPRSFTNSSLAQHGGGRGLTHSSTVSVYSQRTHNVGDRRETPSSDVRRSGDVGGLTGGVGTRPFNVRRGDASSHVSASQGGKVYESSHRGRGGQAKRVEVLLEFHQNFSSSYQSSSPRTSGSSVTPAAELPTTSSHKQETSSSQIAVDTNARRPANAWNKGPPSNIRSTAASAAPSSSAGGASRPTAACEGRTPGRAHDMVIRSPAVVAPSAASDPIIAAQPSNKDDRSAQPAAGPSNVRKTASFDALSSKPATSSAAATLISASTSLPPSPQLTRIAESSSLRVDSGEKKSSGEISPTDPSDKKFRWNVNAPVFTPKFQAPHSQASSPPTQPAPAFVPHLQHSAYTGTASFAVQQNVPVIPHLTQQQLYPYAASGYASAHYPAVFYQGLYQQSSHINASVANGSVGAIMANISDARGVPSSAAAVNNRRAQQLIQSSSVYLPGQATNYAHPQHMISHYQVPLYPPPYQQMTIGAAANVPPPSVPPTQPIQAHTTQGTLLPYSRPYFPVEPVNYMVTPAPTRYVLHQSIEPRPANASSNPSQQSTQQATQPQPSQQAQSGSSATPSSGNGSNDQTSQPATPGPSPAQMPYPQSGTPQSPHALMMQIPISGVSSQHPQHMLVQTGAAPYPFITNQPTSYMVFGTAPHHLLHVHPNAVANAGQVSFSQAHGLAAHQQQQQQFGQQQNSQIEQQQHQQFAQITRQLSVPNSPNAQQVLQQTRNSRGV